MSARRRLAVAAAAALLIAGATPAAAVRPTDVPDPRAARGGWVTDVAGALDPATRDSLDALAGALSERQGAQMAFAIVPETSGEDPRAFATALFQHWGVGRAGVDDGLLVLVVTEARRIEVETGYGLEGVLPDARVGAILDQSVVPHFRQGDLGGGLLAGARAFAAVIVAGPEAEVQRLAAAATSRAEERRRVRDVLIWVFGLLAVLASGGWLVRNVRFCPKCRRVMRRYDERSDDAWLSVAERLEETLKSVDHRVWRCEPCGILTVEHARRLLSSYEDCPQCSRRTVQVERVTVRPASTSREGLAEVTRRCQNTPCGYHDRRHEVLARIVAASSSGGSFGGSSGGSRGGSFGGGRSGGGGAGRSW